jgi:small subunit ribosomal protein S1
VSGADDDFATLFEASQGAKRLEKGQTVEGTVVAIGPEVAFVDVGGKGEAVITIDQLQDEAGAMEVAVGDRIQAVVVSTEGGLTLSRRLARGAATDRQLEDAFEAGLPVEGRVQGAVKGGYEVRVGRHRAFCPVSQIDTARNTEPAEHVGRVYAFRILEYKEGGRDLVVSRRALLEEEQRARAAELRSTVVPGAVLTGRVTSVREFGAFVDLGAGVQGLLHVSEMGWSRVSNTAEVVSPGDEVTVKVLRVDDELQRIALGLKQLTADPWTGVPSNYEVGQVRTGRVTRLAQFGAFVELEPGVEGLAHASAFPPTGQRGGWSRSVPVGTTAAFEILSIDVEQKRIGLAPVPEGSARLDGLSSAADIRPGARVRGQVERHESFGVFVFLAPGRTGLVPSREIAVAKDADLVKELPVGSEIEVMVLEVDPDGHRIRLSRKAVLEADEADEVRRYGEGEQAASSESFGSLADKLRGALKPREK